MKKNQSNFSDDKSCISRRDFMNLGARGLAVASIPLFFGKNVAHALTPAIGGGNDLGAVYQHFNVDAGSIRKLMTVALGQGADYCDFFFQHRISNYVVLEDKAVNRAYTDVEYGVGIRVLKGDQTGFSFTEDLTMESIKNAAKTAATIASGSQRVKPSELKYIKTPNYYPIETSWEDVKIQRKIPFLEKINDRIFSLDKRVIKTNVMFFDQSSTILIATSEGRVVSDYQPMTSISVSCTAEQKGEREQNYYSINKREGIELFTPKNVELIATEVVRKTVDLFDAIKPSGGEMEVVLAPGSSGILLHEAIGHGMEADFNRKKTSIFSDKIGKPVAEKFVSIVDDGTNPHMRGAINVDDEANESKKTYLVENGILTSYLHDRISAQHYKLKPTGNGRMQCSAQFL